MLLKVNTDPEIFSQIVFSVLCNILYFIKNLSEVNITISFDQGFIEFSYDKAFPINDEILRINSDPIILNEISEPFVIGFGNIFEALEYLEMQCIIEHRDGVNSIKIMQNNLLDKSIRDNVSSIIDITARLKTKSNNDN